MTAEHEAARAAAELAAWKLGRALAEWDNALDALRRIEGPRDD